MDWEKNYSAAIVVCNREGIITYLNDAAAAMYAANGGYDLIGKCIFDCHQQSSNDMMNEIMRTRKPHVYSIEKKGKKRLLYQAPYIENDEVMGIVEVAMEIPFDIPHYVKS